MFNKGAFNRTEYSNASDIVIHISGETSVARSSFARVRAAKFEPVELYDIGFNNQPFNRPSDARTQTNLSVVTFYLPGGAALIEAVTKLSVTLAHSRNVGIVTLSSELTGHIIATKEHLAAHAGSIVLSSSITGAKYYGGVPVLSGVTSIVCNADIIVSPSVGCSFVTSIAMSTAVQRFSDLTINAVGSTVAGCVRQKPSAANVSLVGDIDSLAVRRQFSNPTLSAESNLSAIENMVAFISKTICSTGGITITPVRVRKPSLYYGSMQAAIVSSGIAVHIGNSSVSLVGATHITTTRTLLESLTADVRYIKASIRVYFDGPEAAPVIFDQDTIESFTLLEELQNSDSEKPLGTISANELSVALDNTDGSFTPSNVDSEYYGKLKPNVRIEPYLQVAITDTYFANIELGSFYTDDWKAPTEQSAASVVGYDRLYFLEKKELPTISVLQNTSIQEMFQVVFFLAGLATTDFVIDTALNVPVTIGWLPIGTVGNALSMLAEAGQCFVFVNRQNKIEVRCLDLTAASTHALDDETQIISANFPTEYLSTYSKLIIKQYLPELATSKAILETKVDIAANGTTSLVKLSLGDMPVGTVDRVALVGTNNSTITKIKTDAWFISVDIENAGAAESGTIVVYGRLISQTSTDIVIEDSTYKALVGEKVLTVDNPMMQDSAHVASYSSSLFSLIARPDSSASLTIRGNPSIYLGDVLTMSDPSDKLKTEDVLVTRRSLSFIGSIEETLEGIKIA